MPEVLLTGQSLAPVSEGVDWVLQSVSSLLPPSW